LPHCSSLTLSVFALTLFLSAILLFLVQPMVGKMLLPLLGGTPAVWNTCMVFFQAALLGGYLYAHTLSRLGIRWQTIVHTGVLLLPLLVLPITVHPHWLQTGERYPSLQVLALLSTSVGLPFFVVSTSAPLFQKWFATTGHRTAPDPYFLYSASNLGSMVALVSYPFLVEPSLRLVPQSQLWAVGYLVLVMLTVGCTVLVWLSSSAAELHPAAGAFPMQDDIPAALAAQTKLSYGRRLRWVVLAFVPSSLMLGATLHITTDIAAIPLLWVLPLALYLLSFILVFARLPQGLHQGMVRIAPVMLLILIYIMIASTPPFWKTWMTLVLHLVVLFVVAMVCHGELARSRPPAVHLTAFYLWMSVGGMVGGLFNALLAPLLFTTVAEYPLILALSCLLLPAGRVVSSHPWSRWLDIGVPGLIAALSLGLMAEVLVINVRPDRLSTLYGLAPEQLNDVSKQWLRFDLEKLNAFGKFGIPVLLCYLCAARPVRFGLSVGAVVLTGILWVSTDNEVLHRERSFFGVMRVEVTPNYRKLLHGTTLHGVQSRDPLRRQEPLTYYHRTGPIGQVFEAFEGTTLLEHIAVVGLGTGTLACYSEAGHTLTFYEIDPAIYRIASEPRYFTYLQDAKARGVTLQVVLGDARLKLAAAPDRQYGIIVIDAFSSDAIPVHLMTREALALYVTKLAAGGLVALHISNRHLDLVPVLSNLSQAAHLAGLWQQEDSDESIGKLGSQWVVLARRMEDLGQLTANPERWKPLAGRPDVGVWTDDFSNLLSVFQWQK